VTEPMQRREIGGVAGERLAIETFRLREVPGLKVAVAEFAELVAVAVGRRLRSAGFGGGTSLFPVHRETPVPHGQSLRVL